MRGFLPVSGAAVPKAGLVLVALRPLSSSECMQTKRSLLFIVVFFGGCAASQVARYVVPPAQAGTSPQRWEYQCAQPTGNLTAMANEFGREGWEMSAAASTYVPGEPPLSAWCFKRPLP